MPQHRIRSMSASSASPAFVQLAFASFSSNEIACNSRPSSHCHWCFDPHLLHFAYRAVTYVQHCVTFTCECPEWSCCFGFKFRHIKVGHISGSGVQLFSLDNLNIEMAAQQRWRRASLLHAAHYTCVRCFQVIVPPIKAPGTSTFHAKQMKSPSKYLKWGWYVLAAVCELCAMVP